MNIKLIVLALVLAFACVLPKGAHAQSCTSTNVTESFNATTTNCSWYYIGGACLTASTTPPGSNPGVLPGCTVDPYYSAVTLVGGNTGTLPDVPAPAAGGGGALRLTNDSNTEGGSIISNVPFALKTSGVQVTFTTETYEGDSGGTNKDGADGISFFLQDASQPVTLGDAGGSLGYTCSNVNGQPAYKGYDGMVGGFLGLGIDEYGNFLNGDVVNSSGVVTYGGDNTSSGNGKQTPNAVGLRGAGSTAWATLSTNAATSLYYPLTLTVAQQQAAVLQACQTGYAWDFRTASATAGGTVTNGINNPYNAIPVTSVTLPNYAAIPNAYKILSHNIANEAALYRGYGTTSTSGANYGIPISYNLTITTAGLLSLSYSFNGGNYQPVITGQNILTSNGPLPTNVRFGFAGSTGGSRNIHEIMCFQAQPQNTASSSAGLNQKQTAKVQTGTQVYFAFYNANNWTGSLTSQYLDSPDGNPNDLQIDPNVNWDASCVLTGLAEGATCPTTGAASVAAEDPDAQRVIITSTNPVPVQGPAATQAATGIPFTWTAAGATSLSAYQQAALDYGDPAATAGNWPYKSNLRLEYLRGVRGNEQNSSGVDPNTPTINPSGFRQRTSVLGDIVDSSPTWVGGPSASFPATWTDNLNTGTALPENSGPSYASFETTYVSRMNVVYSGANDGFLHGFRTGYFNSTGTYAGATNTSGAFVGTDNDGTEVLAYMPAYVVNAINSSQTLNTSTGTTSPNVANDYTNPQYAHKFNVDGTPGSGDLFYGGAWHSWLVGGLGAGGSAIYALDITNPGTAPTFSNTTFTQGNASALVVGEWSSALVRTTTSTGTAPNIVYSSSVTAGSATFICAGNTTCGNSLGNTYGTPQIRRFHNTPANTAGGATSWGAVFGNGSGSYNGDAGIFVMLASNTVGAQPTFYYLSTGVGSRTGGNPNGIYYVTAADLDGDHLIDYVYAGDLLGNVWRFDLTSQNPSNWAVTQLAGSPAPIYTTPGGKLQPITTKLVVASVASTTSNPRVLVEFGTGEQTAFTNSAPATYSQSQQYLIGIWDWNMGAWNATTSPTKYDALTSTTSPVAPGTPLTGLAQLQQQTITGTFNPSSTASSASSTAANNAYYRTVSNTAVCWADQSGCTGAAGQYGWYLTLGSGFANQYDADYPTPSITTSSQQVYEQVIFSPTLADGAFLVNTTIPPTQSLADCLATQAGGWTMAINPATGGSFTNSFFGDANHNFLNIDNESVSGIALNGTGSPSVVTAGTNTYLVTQTVSGQGALAQINPPGATMGSRLTWIEKR
jgi:type IV pilus assembly protein PilY1